MALIDMGEKDEFNPKKITEALIARCKQAQVWMVYCVVDELWTPNGEKLPFELTIKDGIFICRVIGVSQKEAFKLVANALPVLTFIDNYDE